jgi:hypothetical protein
MGFCLRGMPEMISLGHVLGETLYCYWTPQSLGGVC